jgi:hypothetical protein
MSVEDRLKINLTELLGISPEAFLKYIQTERNHSKVQSWIDEQPIYETWFTPNGVEVLILLVGDLKESFKGRMDVFGVSAKISNSLGIKIFDALIKFESNFSKKDYYGKDLKEKCKTIWNQRKCDKFRINNLEFLAHIREVMGWEICV